MRHAELQRGHRPKNSNCNTWRLTYPGGSGVSLASIRQRATRLTSAPFRAQARRAWYAASYTGAAVSGGSGHVHHAFLLPFSRRHLLPEPSCSRHGIPRCCLPAGGRSCRTVTGFPRSARPSHVRCRAPPLPRGRGARLAGVPTPASTAASQQPALNPRNPSIARAPLYEALRRGSHCSPFRTSPHLSPADGSPALGLPPGASHPTAQTVRDACQERGRALSTRPELTASHTALHSASCRVAPVHCCTGAPSGPRMHVPAHAAQASR